MAGRPRRGTRRERRKTSTVTRRDGIVQRLTTYMVYPLDSMGVGETFTVAGNPQKLQAARNSAYQYGARHDMKFSCYRITPRNGRAYVMIRREE